MGSYPGVGIEVVPDGRGGEGRCIPSRAPPAERAGLKPGDVIVKIDGEDIGGDLAGAIARMRGASGSLVRLTIRRSGTAGLLEYSAAPGAGRGA